MPTAVDDFLRTAFDFGVAALHRVEVQIGGIAAGVHRRSGTAAQADQHAGAAELNQQRAFGNAVFMGLLRLNAAQTTGNHNRLVIAAHAAVVFGFKGAEIAEQVGAAEFVVERGTAQRAVDHDVERRGDVFGFAVGLFPRLRQIGQVEVGHGKTGEAGFRARATAGGAFVTDFTARTSGRTGKRGDGGGVVVGFHLHDDVGVFFVETVALIFGGSGVKALDFRAFDNGRVVFIRDYRAFRAGFVGVANHAEQRFGLRFAV